MLNGKGPELVMFGVSGIMAAASLAGCGNGAGLAAVAVIMVTAVALAVYAAFKSKTVAKLKAENEMLRAEILGMKAERHKAHPGGASAARFP